MRKQKMFKKNQILLLTVIIMVQLCVFAYLGFQKRSCTIDEIYSYILSNSYDTDRISNADWMYGQWVDADDFREFVTVQDGEGFAYDHVYYNNSLDCHPPLFYWMLHTVCSFFPNVYSSWFGIVLNMGLYIVSAFILYLLSLEIFENKVWTFAPLLLYGFSAFAADTVLYIRMYELLMLFSLLLVLVHVRMFKNGPSPVRFLLTWLIIFAGTFTQYYFAILSFFTVAIFCLYLLIKGHWKSMLVYGAGCLAAIIGVVAAYPAVITQVTGSNTNNVSGEITRNLFNIPLFLKMTYEIFQKTVSRICEIPRISRMIPFAFCILLVIYFVRNYVYLKIKAGKTSASDPVRDACRWLFLSCFLTILVICLVGGEYVFMRYLYFIYPLMYILFAYVMERCFKENSLPSKGLLLLAVLFTIGNAGLMVRWNDCIWLGSGTSALETELGNLSDYRAVVISRHSAEDMSCTGVPTGNLETFCRFEDVYMGDLEEVLEENPIEAVLEEDGSCVVYVNTETYFTNGYSDSDVLEQIQTVSSYTSCEEISAESLCDVYLLSR